jgi:hypothetical protein
MKGGVYVYRARKPAARLRIPVLSYHFVYVGETTSFYHRHRQHTEQRPWADLEPRVVARIPLPSWKWLLHLVEALVILAVWPVYNHRKNLWNPRRVSLPMQAMQRRHRDRFGRTLNFTWAHAALLLAAMMFFFWMVTR